MSIQIINGIQLPAFDVEMLTLGKLIAVPFNQSQKEGKVFWLYPTQKLPYNFSLEQYYQPEYLTKAVSSFENCKTYPIYLKAWARCERYWRINTEQKYLLPKIAQSTIWNLSALEHIFEHYQVLKLLILRVYSLSSPCKINVVVEPGAFYWPKPEDCICTGKNNDISTVSEASFNKRKTLFLSGEISPYTDIEALQFQCEQSLDHNTDVQRLNYDIKKFLGWTSNLPNDRTDVHLDWTKTIASLGNRSKEQDEGKSNYQAGTDFENIVRKSLEFLGFKVDYFHKGGAGGVDVFCSHPYPLIAECKAGKKIPNDTAVQLLNLGTLRLKSQELFQQATKLIIGPGEPTTQLADAAKIQNMAIINPETLEKLVKLQSNYRNSIDLFKLKNYLKFGQTDQEVEKYIQQVEQDIKLRSHIIQLVKKHLEITGAADVKVDALKVAYIYDSPPQNLEERELYEILIELSSPLTGYLGRVKSNDWKTDKFYYLRDLPTT